MRNLCARVGDICCLFIIFLFLENNAFSYPNNRPTEQSVRSDVESCLPMWGAISGCVLAYKSGMSVAKRLAVCSGTLAGYNGIRAGQESAAADFRNNSYVANHQDLNSDGLNDFSITRPQDCFGLIGRTIPKVLVDTAGAVHRIWSEGDPPQLQYSAGGVPVGNVPISMSFLLQTYTDVMVAALPGCSRDPDGNIIGTTKELFDPRKYVDNNDTSRRCDGVRVNYDGGEECILENDCKNVGASAKLVCAYEVDDMICAEGVYCSMNIAALDFGAEGILGVLESALGLNFDNITGRVGDGVDSYSSADNNEVIECKNLCNAAGEFLREYRGPDMRGNPITRSAGDGTCFDDLACDTCYDASGCIDSSTAQRTPDCDPSSLLIDHDNDPPAFGKTKERVCGYVFNPKYLAHCVPKPYTAYQGNFVFPRVISPHCTGKAKVRGSNNEDVKSWGGRAIRCIDQTMKNIFYGTYNVVDDHVNRDNGNVIIQNQVIGIGCLSDSASYFVITDPSQCTSGTVSNVQGELRCNTHVVSSPSDCGNGLFVRFQDYAKNIVSITLVFAMLFVGIMVTFGLFDSLQTALKYIVVFGVVLYFVHGNAWRDGYFDFLIDGGTELGSIVFNSLDFGEITSNTGLSVDLPRTITCEADGGYGPNNIIYPNDVESKYMAWDMYDCRMFNFFAPSDIGSSFMSFFTNSFFSIIAFVAMAVILGPITMLVFIFVLLKSLFLITSTMIIITLLVFISPLIIPLVLFTNQKLRGIFDNWLKQLIGYSMVPIILLIVLGIFFKVLDSSMYGTNIGDVYNVDAVSGATIIDNECREIFMPCFLHKMESGQYDGHMRLLGFSIPWIGQEGMRAFLLAALRLFFVFIVMLMVFSLITKSLIQGLLGVSVMEDNVMGAMKKGLKLGLSVAGQALVKGKAAAGKAAKAMKGRNDNDYGTK